jgi:hypothetical protein
LLLIEGKGREGKEKGERARKLKEKARSPRKGPKIHEKGPKVDNQILTKIREIRDNSGS